jgi:CheY-like chemotaxis protein
LTSSIPSAAKANLSPERPLARVLVVDDEARNRDLLDRWLTREGFQVTLATSGLEALLQIADKDFDLVLLDIMMPGKSGLEVLTAIRERHSAAELPVIMITALVDSLTTVRALESGANDYVTKPIDFPIVLARIQTQLRARESRNAADVPTAAPALTATLPPPVRPLHEVLDERMLAGFGGGFLGIEALVGQVLAGRYRLESIVGTGAYGAVFRATQLGLQRLVAVKVLMLNLRSTAEDLARFQREAVLACRIRHPNAVEVMDVDIAPGGHPYLVMELLEGRSLADELKERGRVPLARCLEILAPVADVLAEAHAMGMVHRDLKPANIFIHRSKLGEVVKVVDFGLAKLVGDAAEPVSEQTHDGRICGTPSYMAPERWESRPYDGKSDVYSLGITLYIMLAARFPFEGARDYVGMARQHLESEPTPLGELCPDLPPGVASLVAACLAKRAEDRPAAADLPGAFASAAGLELDLRPYRNLGTS